jgi:hypothetical protein
MKDQQNLEKECERLALENRMIKEQLKEISKALNLIIKSKREVKKTNGTKNIETRSTGL